MIYTDLYPPGTKKILITGSRWWGDYSTICDALKEHGPGVVIEGGARGADNMARFAAESMGWPTIQFPANWDKYGKSAGPIRNQEMIDQKPDVCLAFPLDESRGTLHCMKAAERAGIPVHVYPPGYRTGDPR